MAESVVSFVVERLGDFLIEEAKFIHGVGGQVQEIYEELRWIKAFLKDADAKQDEDERIRVWVADVRTLAYDAGDVLESFLLRVESKRGGGIKNILKRYICILNECVVLHEVGKEILDIKSRISGLKSRLETYGIRSLSKALSAPRETLNQLRRTYSHSVDDDFVGLQGDVEELVGHLVKDGDDCYSLVSICGLGGLGKTTIARKVYNHAKVKRHFEAFAWVCISQKWQPVDILQQILIKFIPQEKFEIMKLRDYEMIKKLFEIQQHKRCLVVLDDIWKKEAWDCIKEAFPKENRKSKLLLTSRNKQVAIHVNSDGFNYEPRVLTNDEVWMHLKKKAFGKNVHRRYIDPEEVKEMEKLGIELVKHCKGLPLAVIVLGGILVSKHCLADWKNVGRNIKSLIRKGESRGEEHGGVSEILELSYTDLPYYLKPCFLYLSKFPEDSEIKAELLYHLWMAESMVLSETKGEEETMMDVAESYLGELAQRSMVQVQLEEIEYEFRKYKSCRLHDMVRELCLSKAKEEDFFYTIDIHQNNNDHEDDVGSSSSSKITARRVVINFQDVNSTSKVVTLHKKNSQRLRSLSILYNEQVEYNGCLPRMVKSHLNDFKLLRVLAIEGFRPDGYGVYIQSEDVSIESSKVKFPDHFRLPNAIGSLIHLTYLSLEKTCFVMFPSSIKNLKQLQTLILTGFKFKFFGQSMENVLGKMRQLRHLYLPHVKFCTFNGSKLRLERLINLEVLFDFNTSWCRTEDLMKLMKLRKFKALVTKSDQLKATREIISYLTSTNSKYLRHASIDIKDCDFISEEWQPIIIQLLGGSCVHKLFFHGQLGIRLPALYNNNNMMSSTSTLPSTLSSLYLYYSKLVEDPMPILEALPNLRILYMDDVFEGTEMICSTNGFVKLTMLEIRSMRNLKRLKVENGAMIRLSKLELYKCKCMKMVPEGLRFITTLKRLQIRWMSEEFTKRVRAVRDGEKGEDFDVIGHVPSIIIFTD